MTRKISQFVANVFHGSKDVLRLENLNAVKDWEYAKDYVEAMWMMLQQDYPDDFVIGTGELHTFRDFAELSFKEMGIDIKWIGSGANEASLSRERTMIKVDKQFYRPLESDN